MKLKEMTKDELISLSAECDVFLGLINKVSTPNADNAYPGCSTYVDRLETEICNLRCNTENVFGLLRQKVSGLNRDKKKEKKEVKKVVSEKDKRNKELPYPPETKLMKVVLEFERDIKQMFSDKMEYNTPEVMRFIEALDTLKYDMGFKYHIPCCDEKYYSEILDITQQMRDIYRHAQIDFGDKLPPHLGGAEIAELNRDIDKLFKELEEVDYLDKLIENNKRGF